MRFGEAAADCMLAGPVGLTTLPKARIIARVNSDLRICVVWLSFLLICAFARAEVYQAGDSFNGFSAIDQRGASFSFKPGIYRYVIFETAGEPGSSTPPRDANWFENHRALLLVDISGLSGFKRRIARSRMESKPFKILVVDNKDAAARFPKQKEKFTVLLLDEAGKITGIRYATPGKELQDLLSEGKKP
jgi:hypothetical protein